jgi:hypothetical protein
MAFDTVSFSEGIHFGLLLACSAGLLGLTIDAVISFFKILSGG